VKRSGRKDRFAKRISLTNGGLLKEEKDNGGSTIGGAEGKGLNGGEGGKLEGKGILYAGKRLCSNPGGWGGGA